MKNTNAFIAVMTAMLSGIAIGMLFTSGQKRKERTPTKLLSDAKARQYEEVNSHDY